MVEENQENMSKSKKVNGGNVQLNILKTKDARDDSEGVCSSNKEETVLEQRDGINKCDYCEEKFSYIEDKRNHVIILLKCIVTYGTDFTFRKLTFSFNI